MQIAEMVRFMVSKDVISI